MLRPKRKRKPTGARRALTRHGRQKVSERVWRLGHEFVESRAGAEHKQNLLNTLCTAWNVACLPRARRQATVQEYLKKYRLLNPELSSEQVETVRRDIEALVEQKEELYPTDKRRITQARWEAGTDGRERIEVVAGWVR